MTSAMMQQHRAQHKEQAGSGSSESGATHRLATLVNALHDSGKGPPSSATSSRLLWAGDKSCMNTQLK